MGLKRKDFFTQQVTRNILDRSSQTEAQVAINRLAVVQHHLAALPRCGTM